MSEDVKNAYEVDSLIIGQGDNQAGFFAGGVLPHIAVSDAPAHSTYYRNTGEVFRVNDQGSSVETNWIDITPSASQFGEIPFITFSGGIDNIALTGTNEIPFIAANGSIDNIGLV